MLKFLSVDSEYNATTGLARITIKSPKTCERSQAACLSMLGEMIEIDGVQRRVRQVEFNVGIRGPIAKHELIKVVYVFRAPSVARTKLQDGRALRFASQ